MRLQIPFQIRLANHSDISALSDVHRESAEFHRSLAPSLYRIPQAQAVTEELSRTLNSSNAAVFVADVEGEIVGYVQVRVLPPTSEASMIQPRKSADVGVAVRTPFRRQGLGSALMRAAQAWAIEHEVEQMLLDCHAANEAAIQLYERLGFQIVGYFMAKRLIQADMNQAA